jgi:transcriptional antiterminator RfaH
MSDQLWYVAQLKSGRERVAIHGLSAQGFPNYYPQMHTTRARHGRTFDAVEPVFPLYLFLMVEPGWQQWRSINNTRGVARLLGNGEPCPIPTREVEELQARDRAGQLRHPHKRQIRQGDLVEFKVGSFVGLHGVCQWTRRERIGVLLKILGGDTVITSPRDWLKLAAA